MHQEVSEPPPLHDNIVELSKACADVAYAIKLLYNDSCEVVGQNSYK